MFNHEPEGYVCPVCEIVAGRDNEAPWTTQEDVVLRDDVATAFISVKFWGRNEGHVIVVPNRHVENIYDLDGELAGQLHDRFRRCAIALMESYGCAGTSIRQHNAPAGNQEVWHHHTHVFPRYPDDGLYGAPFRMAGPEERRPYADRLRAALGSSS